MRYHLKKHLLGKWGTTAADFITAKAVDAWITDLQHLAPDTIRGIVKTLQSVLGRSLKGISYPSKVEVDEDPRCYTEEEVKRIIAEAEGQYKLLFLLATETGARAGELFALTAEDVLFEKRAIRINKSMYKQQVQTPKSQNATRWIVVRPEVMTMLRGHLNGKSSRLVFQTRKGTPLSKDVVNQKHLYPLLEKLGFEKGGMHGFRHHRVSTLVMSGVSKDVIKNQIGHGSEEMIKRYTHLRPEFIQNELNRVRNFVLFDPFDPPMQAVL